MKPFALLALASLLAPAAYASTVATPSNPFATLAEANAATDEQLAPRLMEELQKMERAQSEEFYGAARLVLDATGDPTRFRPLMEQAAEKGSAAATCWLASILLAEMLEDGANPASDPRAVALRQQVFAVADKEGQAYAPALVQASQLAGLGVGAPADPDQALGYLMEACKLDCPQARAGYLLVSGRLQKGGVSDPAVASELKKNNVPLLELIARSKGNTAEAAEWLKKAAEHGSALAPYMLSQLALPGISDEQGKAYLELAAGRHLPEAMAFLGSIKLRAKELSAAAGLELTEDLEGGRRLLQLAAALGHPEAAHTLATSTAQGIFGEPEAALVCRLYKQAAALGEPHGMVGYGYCLLAGLGCEADAARGMEFMRKGIDKGAQWGHQALASVYFNGLGVEPDLQAAVGELWEDSHMGSVHAQAIMAALYALGNAKTAPDPIRARTYLDMAKRSDAEAQFIYDEIVAAKGWRFFSALWQD